MDTILLGLAAASVILLAFHAGKLCERRQIHKWLRFLHLEGLRDSWNPHQLAAEISAGRHYDFEED